MAAAALTRRSHSITEVPCAECARHSGTALGTPAMTGPVNLFPS